MYFMLLVCTFSCNAYISVSAHKTNQWENRSTIVHLFEWKWTDIARECEEFLAPKGYGGVQISPPSENVIINSPFRPWWERYQVMSYKLITRSGNEEEFKDMTRRCNEVGIRIYADVVINHMTANPKNNLGTAGSTADFQKYEYPAVPYSIHDFHAPCIINNYNVATEVRNCQLLALKDLNLGKDYVRDKISDYLNKLIDYGVAGFRVDAAKHMWPEDLKKLYEKLKSLNTKYGFKPDTRPYIYQEVISMTDFDAIKSSEYTHIGAVTEFKVGMELSRAFQGNNPLKWLVNWGPAWKLLPSKDALVFIDNHDNQRGHGGAGSILSYKSSKLYKAAIAFMLAHSYGEPKIMSSFHFDNSDQGPPSDASGNIASATFNLDNTCNNGWVCEHRWRQIYNMVIFRNTVRGERVQHWWDNGNNKIAFCRGNRGFIAFNIEGSSLSTSLKVCVPPGQYCDIVSGSNENGRCTGKQVSVAESGLAHIHIGSAEEDSFLAIHVGPESKL